MRDRRWAPPSHRGVFFLTENVGRLPLLFLRVKNTFFLLRFVSTRLFILSGRAEDPTGVLTLPKAVFNVQAGFRYRFRIVSAGFLFCPLRISVDDHTLLLIATDGKPFVPFEVNEGIVLNSSIISDFDSRTEGI